MAMPTWWQPLLPPHQPRPRPGLWAGRVGPHPHPRLLRQVQQSLPLQQAPLALQRLLARPLPLPRQVLLLRRRLLWLLLRLLQQALALQAWQVWVWRVRRLWQLLVWRPSDGLPARHHHHHPQ